MPERKVLMKFRQQKVKELLTFRKLIHKLKLMYLRPKWRFQRLMNVALHKLKLQDLLDLEDELKEMFLDAKRQNKKDEIYRSEGRLEIMEWLKDWLGKRKE